MPFLPGHKGFGHRGPKPVETARTEALAIARLAATQAQSLSDTQATDLASKSLLARTLRDLTSVWSEALDRHRILCNKPSPGSLRPAPKVKAIPKRKAKPLAIEPLVSEPVKAEQPKPAPVPLAIEPDKPLEK